MKHRGIGIVSNGEYYFIEGLKPKIGKDLLLTRNLWSEADYHSLLMYLIDYLLRPNVQIKTNQTIGYYSWILKFVDAGVGFMSCGKRRNAVTTTLWGPIMR